ncbi:MAG TPA: c-type cytochrome [Longimicrobiales bacterium]|jgi:mono/diheme cytochrome c family protein
MGRGTFVMVVGMALFAAPGTAQQRGGGGGRGQMELPDEVRTWLERDQAQRWRVMLEEGATLYAEGTCGRCHGDDGAGTARGPNLTDTEWVQSDGGLAGIRRTIFWGVKREEFSDESRRFEMNPGGGMQLEFRQYDALTAYVWSLSRQQEGGAPAPSLPQPPE